MKKKLLLLLFIVVIGVTASYFYIYKGHRNIATETADYTVTVSNLQKEFVANDSLSYQKYKDKTIQISGRITSIDSENKAIVIDEKLYATFLNILSNDVKVGNQITIKGRFLGYDDLLEEFKIDQTTVVE